MAELEPEISAAIASEETNGAREGELAVVAVLEREWDRLLGGPLAVLVDRTQMAGQLRRSERSAMRSVGESPR
jgi:hypothetical protein